MSDLPVAAPDPASVIEHFLTLRSPAFMDELPRWSDAKKEARAALAALLVERQQDKERIERLETALRFYADSATYEESSAPHPTLYASGIVPIEDDLGERAAAALAVEEDAPPEGSCPHARGGRMTDPAAAAYLSQHHETSEAQILAQVVEWIIHPEPVNALPASPDDVLWLLVQLDRTRHELSLVYGELNVALGAYAPKAWDRIKEKLGAR